MKTNKLTWIGNLDAQRQADEAFARLKNKKKAKSTANKKKRKRKFVARKKRNPDIPAIAYMAIHQMNSEFNRLSSGDD
jgi:hypothetical protein